LGRIAGAAPSYSMTVNIQGRRNDQLCRIQRQCKRNLVQRGWVLRGAHNRRGQILLTAGSCGMEMRRFRRTGNGMMAIFGARWNDPDSRPATIQSRAARSANWREEHSQYGCYGNGAGVRPPGPARELWHPYFQRINATPLSNRRQCRNDCALLAVEPKW
jgi:hypothetical protein